MQEANQILTLNVGPSQLLSQLCDEIEFEKVINDLVEWDPVRCSLSPGTRIKALVLNILCMANHSIKSVNSMRLKILKCYLGPTLHLKN